MPCPDCRELHERLTAALATQRIPRQTRTLAVNPDAVAVSVAGDRPYTLTTGEILEAVAVMTRDGVSAREIGQTLRIDQRSVFRHRARLRDEGRLS